jgi:hypothetical protein
MSSSIPGAVANLITILTAALPSTVEVYFSADEGKYKAQQALLITGVMADQQPAELSPEHKVEESYAIQCKLVSFAGDQSSAAYIARMTEVMALFQTVTITISNNYSLSTTVPPPPSYDVNSAVRQAEIGTIDLVPKPAALGGSSCELSFDVHCSQRITTLT